MSELLSNRSSWDITKDIGVKLPEISKFSVMKKKVGDKEAQFKELEDNMNEESEKYFNERSKSLMKKRQKNDKASLSIKRHFKNKKHKKGAVLDNIYSQFGK